MTQDARTIHFLRGWKIIKVQKRQVATKEECHKDISFHKGNAWLIVNQPRSKRVIVSKEDQDIALKMHNVLQGITPTIAMRGYPQAKGWGRPMLMEKVPNGVLEAGSPWRRHTPWNHPKCSGSHYRETCRRYQMT